MTDKEERLQVAKKVKQACINAAQEGFKDASMRGLCREGAEEAAISAIQRLKLNDILENEDSYL